LKAKIQDWSTCPTTDPQTKRAIVGRLQIQLDALTSSIEGSANAKGSQQESSSQPNSEPLTLATGLGAEIDLRA